MALGDHGGGRIGFSWKMKGAFGIEKGRGRAFWKRGDYLTALLLITCMLIMLGRVLHLHLLALTNHHYSRRQPAYGIGILCCH
jgi:hypothetical protein